MGLFSSPCCANMGARQGGDAGRCGTSNPAFYGAGRRPSHRRRVALAASLAKSHDVASAFAAYQSLRLPRVRRVIATASGNAWKYHLSFPPVRLAAHLCRGHVQADAGIHGAAIRLESITTTLQRRFNCPIRSKPARDRRFVTRATSLSICNQSSYPRKTVSAENGQF